MQVNSIAAWRINNDEAQWQSAPEDDAQVQILPGSIGNCCSKLFKINPDLNYIETHYNPNRNLAVLSRIASQEPRMVLTLGLAGQSSFQDKQGSEIHFKSGYSTVTTFKVNEGDRQFQSNQAVTQLRFSMTQKWLERHFGEGAFAAYFKANALQIVSHQPSATTSLLAARNLLHNSLPAKALAVLRQGQIMAIVASELGHLLNDAQHPPQITPRDKQMAQWAREILAAEYKHPPSVEELSRRVGTNPFKLKQLFHHCFNSTPYGLLLDIRMAKAHQMLSVQHCPIGIAAEEVGYRHASNFSTAFLKYFGFPPKQLSRKA